MGNEFLEYKIKNAKQALSRARDSVKLWEQMLERYYRIKNRLEEEER